MASHFKTFEQTTDDDLNLLIAQHFFADEVADYVNSSAMQGVMILAYENDIALRPQRLENRWAAGKVRFADIPRNRIELDGTWEAQAENPVRALWLALLISKNVIIPDSVVKKTETTTE